MAEGELPYSLKKFIFECIDSVEQLEILLMLSADRTKAWSPESLNLELRSNVNSVKKRLSRLRALGLIKSKSNSPEEYYFSPETPELEQSVAELSEVYATKKHRVLEMVFTPLKQVRFLADAFRLSSKNPDDGENDG